MIRSVCSVKGSAQRKVLTASCGFALKISFRFIISLNFTFATDLPDFLWLNEEIRNAAFSDNLFIIQNCSVRFSISFRKSFKISNLFQFFP